MEDLCFLGMGGGGRGGYGRWLWLGGGREREGVDDGGWEDGMGDWDGRERMGD